MLTKVTIDSPEKVSKATLKKHIGDCQILVLAAGFEARAFTALEMVMAVSQGRPHRIVLVRYPHGQIAQNDDAFDLMSTRLTQSSIIPTVADFDARHPDDYLENLKTALFAWRPDVTGEVWIDISALPMQGICSTLAAVRETLPSLTVRVLYTEAKDYFPTRNQVRDANGPTAALSQEMSGNLIPKRFGGSSSDVSSTCLVVFAGYENHRSLGVIEGLNPSKLVLVFGRPERKDLQWRLSWSQKIHRSILDTRPTATEVVSTLDPVESLELLNRYYNFLFADHAVSVAPICSKMQCIACYLLWERYRDVQLVFPCRLLTFRMIFRLNIEKRSSSHCPRLQLSPQ